MTAPQAEAMMARARAEVAGCYDMYQDYLLWVTDPTASAKIRIYGARKAVRMALVISSVTFIATGEGSPMRIYALLDLIDRLEAAQEGKSDA